MKKTKIIIAVIALVAVIAAAVALWWFTRPETQAGTKTFTVTVVHGDGGEKTFTYQTNQEYVGQVLLEEGLVEGTQEEYGLYMKVVDGERAVWEENQAWWGIYIGEESAVTGADEIVLTDGGVYKLVFSVA